MCTGSLSTSVAILSHRRWAMLLVLVSAALSCTLQIGYSSSAILMTAHATGQRPSWLGAVSDVARTLVPPMVVNHVLLQPVPPTKAELIETHGLAPRGAVGNGTNPDPESDDDIPWYVVAWLTFNTVAASVFGVLSVFFLCTVDVMRILEGLCKGWMCCTSCQASCSRPLLDKLKVVQFHVTKVHCMYNVASQGITALVTLPLICPVPCKPQISFAYLGTLGLIISSLKFFEAIVHKIAISVENIRAFGKSAWQLCDSATSHSKGVGGQENRVLRLMQICLGVAENAESAVEFLKEYIRDDLRQGVSLTVALATFPVQPFGLGISVMGLLLKDLLPKLEADLVAEVPASLKDAQDFEHEDEFYYWLAEHKYEVEGWKLSIREMSNHVDKVQSQIFQLKAVIKAVVGQGFAINFSSKHVRLSLDDVMRVVDPLVGLLQAEVDATAQKLHRLGDALRLYADKMNGPVDAEVQRLISSIRELLPLGIVHSFVKDTPGALLARLLAMMEASKKAGADELMLEVSPELLALANWAVEHHDVEEPVPVVADEFVRQDHHSDVGYSTGGSKRFALLTSWNRYSKLTGGSKGEVRHY